MTADVAHPPPDSVVSLTFEVTDSSVPVRAVSEMSDCRFRLEEVVPRGGNRYATYYSVDGGDPDRILELAAEHETSEAQFIDHGDARELVELTVPDDSPLVVLAADGAIVRQSVVEDGRKTLTVEVAPEYDANGIIARFGSTYPDAELTARKQQSYATPVFNSREFERAVEERLTDRQHGVLRLAHEEGFYEWPRERTGEQLSEELGISPPTFNQHLRAAERKLVQIVFDASGVRDDGRQ